MTSATLLAAQRLFAPRSRTEKLLALLALLLLPLFFLSGPHWLGSSWGSALSNLFHIPFFALLTAIATTRLQLRRPTQWLAFSGLIVALSVAIEVLQAQVGRSASLHDILRNLTGAWLALFWLQGPSFGVWLGRLLASTLLIVEIALAISAVQSYFRLQSQLPVVANLEAASEVERWKAINSELQITNDYSSEGSFALQAKLAAGDFSGMALQRLPHDWSQYQYLQFELYNPGDERLDMALRIHDSKHEMGSQRWKFSDRFNTKLAVEPGWNRYRIDLREVAAAPQRRNMEMAYIREVRLFASGLETTRVVYADNFHLE